MLKINPYLIGAAPSFDPCEKCLVKPTCSERCEDRIRFILKTPEEIKVKVRLPRRKRRKKI